MRILKVAITNAVVRSCYPCACPDVLSPAFNSVIKSSILQNFAFSWGHAKIAEIGFSCGYCPFFNFILNQWQNEGSALEC